MIPLSSEKSLPSSSDVRHLRNDDLDALLSLYTHLNPTDIAPDPERLRQTWQQIHAHPDVFLYFGLEKDGQLVASCNLTVIPNLTRGARPFGILENVVTHAAYQKQGLGKKIVTHALACARQRNCYKLMLLSNLHRKEAHIFYENLGFRSDEKKGFVIHL